MEENDHFRLSLLYIYKFYPHNKTDWLASTSLTGKLSCIPIIIHSVRKRFYIVWTVSFWVFDHSKAHYYKVSDLVEKYL